MPGTATKQSYSRAEVLRWLAVSERQMRSWERQKIVPTLDVYSFADVAILRSLAGLKKGKIPAAELRRALASIRRHLGESGDPLIEHKLYAHGRKIRVQFAGQHMDAISGQLLFDFDAVEINKLLAFPGQSSRTRIDVRREAEGWFEKGLKLEQNGGSLEDIVDAYRQAAQIDPSSAGALVNLGTVYFNSRRHKEAEQYYKMALDVDPNYALAHFNLASLYDERGHRPLALRHYQSALRIHPHYADAHYNIALLYQASGQALRAVSHLKAYLKLDGSSEWAGIARRELDKLRQSTIVPGARPQ